MSEEQDEYPEPGQEDMDGAVGTRERDEAQEGELVDVMRVSEFLTAAPKLFAKDFRDFTVAELRKAEVAPGNASGQEQPTGRRSHPFKFSIVREYRDFNPYHSACIEAKMNSTVGLGHEDQELEAILDMVCDDSWAATITDFVGDYWETGNGFLEIVRRDDDPNVITGIHHLPANDVWVVVEDEQGRDWHYEVVGSGDEGATTGTQFARFGDLEGFRDRVGDGITVAGSVTQNSDPARVVSEVIHFKFPTTRSRWYGIPEFFAAVPSIEQMQCMMQSEYAFYFNYGVPEFLLFVLGTKVGKKSWAKISGMFQTHQGAENHHKSGAINLGSPEAKIQLEKLALDSAQDGEAFMRKSEVLSRNVVSAHGVPPLLAGIQIPGKMGSNNELPNALALFQLLKIGPAQKRLSRLLAGTLAASDQKIAQVEDAPKPLTREMFLGPAEKKGNGFVTVLDEVNLNEMDTMARMAEPAMGSGRDLSQGLRRNGQDRARTGGAPDARQA